MLMELLNQFSSLLYLLLHVTGNGSFPKSLTSAQEKQYLIQMKEGNELARDKLIRHNLRLVAHIIKKYYASTNDQEDLISIGTIGLIKAIDSFNPDKGIRLSSYASKCIENEILMFFRSGKKTAQDVSINEPIETDKNGNALTIIDTMSEPDNIIEQIDVKMKTEKLYQYIKNSLSAREQSIVFMRYGLGGQKALPQREIARRLGISRSYVSRIEKKALLLLKREFDKSGQT